MPELQEVFRMATQTIRPDEGALERQHQEQRRRTIRRKGAVYGLVAAMVAVVVEINVWVASMASPTRVAATKDAVVTFAGDASGVTWTPDGDLFINRYA